MGCAEFSCERRSRLRTGPIELVSGGHGGPSCALLEEAEFAARLALHGGMGVAASDQDRGDQQGDAGRGDIGHRHVDPLPPTPGAGAGDSPSGRPCAPHRHRPWHVAPPSPTAKPRSPLPQGQRPDACRSFVTLRTLIGGPAYQTRNGSDLCEIACHRKRSRGCLMLVFRF